MTLGDSASDLGGILADPQTGDPLRLVDDGSIEASFVSDAGARFPVRNGIPRFVGSTDAGQEQTSGSFGFKWQQADSWDSEAMRASTSEWLFRRYGFDGPSDMRRHFERAGRVVDLGCGGGYSSSLWMEDWTGPLWVGVDISEAIDVAKDRLGHHPNTAFVQADILHPPFREQSFDAAFSEGVFHHTPSTREAIGSAARLLRTGGELLFYVYRRKAPVREFSDDHIRDQISGLSPDEAWEALRPLTRLAQSLTALKAEIDVPEAIPFLEIPAGRYDVQRLLYWHFAKLFWNDTFSFEENLHVNFDWYHPRYAHRQSEEEVRDWCEQAQLRITRFDIDPSGFTVRATKEDLEHSEGLHGG